MLESKSRSRLRGRAPSETARILGLSAACAGLLVSGAARADLTGDFASALTVDPTYVTGANGATDIAFAADGRAVITQKSGSITIRHTDGTKSVLMGTFPDLDSGSEKGLNGVFADPTTADAFFFYADNGPSTADKHQVYHGVLTADNQLTIDVTKPVVGAGVNTQDEGLEGPANHDGGGLFIYENHLYVSVGDTGQNATPPTNKYTSCLNHGNGKILRVNLDGTIPTDNPLSNETMVTSCDNDTASSTWGMAAPDKRVYAWGLRNAWRFWVDSHTGRMWIGDVGEVTREEISVSEPAAGYKGEHFGYPFHEGTTDWSMDNGALRLDKDCDQNFSPSRPCVPPVTDYGHTDGANCVVGGLIPEGCGWTKAFGGTLYYLFADNGAGWIHALTVKPDRSGVMSSTAIDAGTFDGSGPASIRQGPGGAVYMVNNREGSVYEIKPKDQTGDDCTSMPAGGAGGSSAGTSAMNGGTGMTTAGTGGTATTAGKGGTGTTGGRGGSAGTGGSTGGTTGGSAGTAAAGKTAGGGSGDSGDKGGCGCRVASGGNGVLAALIGGLGLAALSLRRRRGRR